MKNIFKMVSEQVPLVEHCPPVRVGVWVKLRVIFRLGGGSTLKSRVPLFCYAVFVALRKDNYLNEIGKILFWEQT